MNCNIIIKDENRDRITEVINEVENHSRTRKADYIDLVFYTNGILKALSVIISKKDLKGAEFLIQPRAQTVAKCYNGIPEGTAFKVVFNGKDFKLLSVDRRGSNHNRNITFSNEQEFKKFYSVKF